MIIHFHLDVIPCHLQAPLPEGLADGKEHTHCLALHKSISTEYVGILSSTGLELYKLQMVTEPDEAVPGRSAHMR